MSSACCAFACRSHPVKHRSAVPSSSINQENPHHSNLTLRKNTAVLQDRAQAWKQKVVLVKPDSEGDRALYTIMDLLPLYAANERRTPS